jgi:hypothetical protein
MTRHIRVKEVRREVLDDDKLALALWLLAKSAVESKRAREAEERKRKRADKGVHDEQ